MDPLRVIVLALLQGVAELFPISSLGHTVIIPGLLGWGDLLRSPRFLPLVVALHLGTAVALLTFFWRDWVNLLRGGAKVVIAGRFTPDVDPDGYGRQFALVVVGTIPAGVLGVLFQKTLESNFSIPILAAALLAVNGLVLLTVEYLWQAQRRQQVKVQAAVAGFSGVDLGATLKRNTVAAPPGVPPGEVGKTINQVTFGQALLVGLAQSIALLPGFSRSGLSMAAGMALGLSHESAARFSFLLATPLIFGAGAVTISDLFASPHDLILALGGGVLSGIAAYLSVRFLMRYFETNKLTPFAIYCIVAGLLSVGYLVLVQIKVLP